MSPATSNLEALGSRDAEPAAAPAVSPGSASTAQEYAPARSVAPQRRCRADCRGSGAGARQSRARLTGVCGSTKIAPATAMPRACSRAAMVPSAPSAIADGVQRGIVQPQLAGIDARQIQRIVDQVQQSAALVHCGGMKRDWVSSSCVWLTSSRLPSTAFRRPRKAWVSVAMNCAIARPSVTAADTLGITCLASGERRVSVSKAVCA